MKVKLIVRFFCFLTVLISLTCVGLSAGAIETGFDVEKVDKSACSETLSRVNITLKSEQENNKIISCFNVNENGLLAVGFDSIGKKTVDIYTTDGEFLRGYSFNSSGTYNVELDSNNNLIIHLVRSDLSIVVDDKGKVLEMARIKNTGDNNSYWNYLDRPIKQVDTCIYSVKNKYWLLYIFSSGYGQLKSRDGDNSARIIIDVTNAQLKRTLIIAVPVLIFCITVITLLIRYLIKVHKNGGDPDFEKRLIYPLSHLTK